MQTLIKAFQSLPDYREVKITKNNPGEILLLSLMAILSGAEGFADMAEWMKIRKRSIEKLLGKHFSVPAYTTIRNVFLNIDIDAVSQLQKAWAKEISEESSTKEKERLTIISADGKTMRGSSNKSLNEKAKHIVSLFIPDKKLTLAHYQVEEKSNEIPALIKLLEELDMQGCIITMDAMHTQKKPYRKSEKKDSTTLPK